MKLNLKFKLIVSTFFILMIMFSVSNVKAAVYYEFFKGDITVDSTKHLKPMNRGSKYLTCIEKGGSLKPTYNHSLPERNEDG